MLHARTIALAVAATLVALAACASSGGASPRTRDHLAVAEAALGRKDYDAAAAAYDQAVATAPDRRSQALALRERADARVFVGDLAGAAADLDALTTLTPGDPAAWHDLGMVRANAGDRAGAAAAFTRAKAAAPDDARPRLALAALRWADGDRGGARAEYQALLRLDLPDRVRAKVEWAIAELAP
ncbi:MAG: tetratricopeptide repeat protein [Myxococcales bacterium]|nr:tetratricopeptide repeat protein [Myxococcales bacterium]